jgi:hypothetical protein
LVPIEIDVRLYRFAVWYIDRYGNAERVRALIIIGDVKARGPEQLDAGFFYVVRYSDR